MESVTSYLRCVADDISIAPDRLFYLDEGLTDLWFPFTRQTLPLCLTD